MLCPEKDISNNLKYFTDLFSALSLISTAICTKGHSQAAHDVILTNKPKCFHHTSVFITGLTDCHKLILLCLRAHFKRLPPKKFFYRDYKSFNQENVTRT